ncbi:MAG: ABC transporter permease [Candidatus Competibacterales bacterium]|nr:ABC transporter permease [Candidatus Competibacterales bacterium]
MYSQVEPARLDLDGDRVRCLGSWTLAGLQGLSWRLERFDWPAGEIRLDGTATEGLDTSGALRLLRLARELEQQGRTIRFVHWRQGDHDLLQLVLRRWQGQEQAPPPEAPLDRVAHLGRLTLEHGQQALAFLAFVGEVTLVLVRSLRHPTRLRWRSLAAVLETAGANALPIVGLLSFLMGVVIAYQGGLQLKNYGANIFVVELVSLTLLRELSPLLTAIIVAGRTGSAFTAQIGTMRVTEEVDALATIGLNPIAVLVLPKLLGLMIALPLLAVFADGFGLLGGMVMSWLLLDVSIREFVDRLPQAVSATSFLIGIGKAPVFAGLIALVGCYQGFRVGGSAESVGRQTTLSVVQAIFLVIVADAAFSVVFSTLGI